MSCDLEFALGKLVVLHVRKVVVRHLQYHHTRPQYCPADPNTVLPSRSQY